MLGVTNKVIADYIENIKGNILVFKCRDSKIIRKKYNNIVVMEKSEIRRIKNIETLLVITSKVCSNYFIRRVSKLNNEEKIAITIAKRVYIICNKIEKEKNIKVPIVINKFLISKAKRYLSRYNISISTYKTNTYMKVKKEGYNNIRKLISDIPYIIKDGIFGIKKVFRILVVSKAKVKEVRR
ncbi:hypothetical protein [Candidatus Vidania fulgoroideorum]